MKTSFSKKIARLRRKYGIFSEKKVRHINRTEAIDGDAEIRFEVSCRPNRVYSINIDEHQFIDISLSLVKDKKELSSQVIDQCSCLILTETARTMVFTIKNNSDKPRFFSGIEVIADFCKCPIEDYPNKLSFHGHIYEVRDYIKENNLTKHSKLLKYTESKIQFLEQGIPYIEKNFSQLIESLTLPEYTETTEYFAYILNFSLPFKATGYTIRSQAILENVNAIAYTRMQESSKIPVNNDGFVVNKVDYKLLRTTEQASPHDYVNFICQNAQSLLVKLAPKPPKFIVSASNFHIGCIGYLVAKQLNIPFCYEMRGLWHYTRAGISPFWRDSDEYKLAHQSELFLAQQADHVFTLSKVLKNWLVTNQVDKNNITILRNGVDIEKFFPTPKPQKLVNKYRAKNKRVFGFIGSIVKYEGLGKLLKSFKKLHAEDPDTLLIIVGTGVDLKRLKNIAAKHPAIIFTGSVPFHQIQLYYNFCDIMVYPRNPAEVCELVAPLKPLEAMACEKLIICSSVAPMLEYLDDQANGLSYNKSCINDLLEKMKTAHREYDQLASIRTNAREYIIENHQWKNIAQQMNFPPKK